MFWDDLFALKRPIVGLSPMDGVTDAPMRYMTARYGARNNQIPNSNNQIGGVDLLFTEFVSVDALHYATGERRERLLKTFIRAKDVGTVSENQNTKESKIYEIAQVFGNKPELFAEAAVLIENLGFDGIDINMGCPAHKVEENGSGAGLIRTPAIAQEIVRAVNAATKLPVSVKTRIGVDKIVVEEWMEALMEVSPANITLHGRTLKQLYQGFADWEAIGRAAEVVHKRGGRILGNGDVMSLQDGMDKVGQYGVDGFLIGRAAEGNPGIFVKSQSSDHSPIIAQGSELWVQRQISWMVEHARVFESIFPDNFMPMRKHLAWYCKGFPGAVELRSKLMQTNSADEVEVMVSQLLS